MNKIDLGKRILSVSHIDGIFRLRSGQYSDEYFDKYLVEAQPDLLRAVAWEMAELVPPQTEVLAGLEMGWHPGGCSAVTGHEHTSGLCPQAGEGVRHP